MLLFQVTAFSPTPVSYSCLRGAQLKPDEVLPDYKVVLNWQTLNWREPTKALICKRKKENLWHETQIILHLLTADLQF